MTDFAFRISARDGAARTGTLTTAHGPAATPAFMPVGTAATVKGMTSPDVAATGAEIVLVSTRPIDLADTERFASLWSDPLLRERLRRIRCVDASSELLSQFFQAE